MLFHTPLLRAVNLSIAVLLALLLGAVYWYAWRPLAQTSGEITAPISAQASIGRDDLGVPHIKAATWEDAIFLQGYAVAQDRMWQMDALRRAAAGELAEVLGETMLETDREARRFRLARIAEAQERTMTAESKTILSAYARGVNYYLETHRDRLPLEFTLLRYAPRPWRIRDTILIGMYMHRTLTTTWPEEIRKLHMLEKGDREKVSFLYPDRLGPDTSPGSNAWAVSGQHTASGKPILASDPHLEYSMPALWYLVHLKAPDLDVTGAALPGVPAVVIGHNRRIAWGMTNLEFDMQDLYRTGADAQIRVENDAIAVKGAPKPNNVVTAITPRGPLFLNESNQSYALRWVAAELPAFDFAFLAINQAGNWNEFRNALKRYPGPAQNFVYADVDGNIGYHTAGSIPIRSRCKGDLPADPGCEWSGFIPFEDLPEVYNPESGIIVSANQNPFPANYKYPVAGLFAPPYRARQIRALLESGGKWTADGMLTIQKDVYSAFHHFLAQEMVKAWDRRPGSSDQSREAVEELRQWNGQMEIAGAAPVIATLVTSQLRKAAANRAAPGTEDNYSARIATVAIERLLTERPADWFPDYDQLLLDSLAASIAEGEKTLGSSVSRWNYGQFNRLELAHPVFRNVPWIGGYFNIGPVPMSGAPTTVKQRTGRLGPSFRMVVDFGDVEASRANITAGQSAQPFSSHYADQWDAYYAGQSFSMQYGNPEIIESLEITPR